MSQPKSEQIVLVKPGLWRTIDGAYEMIRDPQPWVWRAESIDEGFSCNVRNIWLIYARGDDEPSWAHGPGGGRMWPTLREARAMLPVIRAQDDEYLARNAARSALLAVLMTRAGAARAVTPPRVLRWE